MGHILALCKCFGTEAGAHPSFPDREGFGRRAMTMAPHALLTAVAEQCGALASVARGLELPLRFVKPHGALYHAANADRTLAEAVLRGAIDALGHELTVLGPPSGMLRDVAAELGLGFAREGFADRAMRADGSLVPRGEPGAMLLESSRGGSAGEEARGVGGHDLRPWRYARGARHRARGAGRPRMTQRLGSRALRLPRPDLDAARLVAAGRSLPGVVDVVLTDGWIALYFAEAAPEVAPDLLAAAASLQVSAAPPREHALHVRYDGEDLDAVAREVGLPVAEVIALHGAPIYEVAFMGFLPGFPYLHGLDPRLVLPRRSTPRARVPAGAVAIGGPYAGVYPLESPGGWHLLGQLLTPQLLGEAGPLLRPGDRVRFVEAP